MTVNPTRKSLEQIEDSRLNAEKQTVLAQPHRRGERGDMTDNFGTFLRFAFGPNEQDLMRRCWEAGQAYIAMVAKWRRAKGIPQRWLMDEKGDGNPLHQSVIDKWFERISRCENVMKCSGLPGFYAAHGLILDDKCQPVELSGPIKRAVINLAVEIGTVEANALDNIEKP